MDSAHTTEPETLPDGSAAADPAAAAPLRQTPHERLLMLGLRPVGRGSEFSDQIHELMSRTPMFSALDPDETRKLGAFMYVYDVVAGTTLISEGEAGDFMILLMTGMVDVLRKNRYN